MNKPTADLLEAVFEFEPRLGTPDDVGYVLNTWERSLRDEYLEADNQDFAAAIRESFKRELESGANLLVASPAGNSSMVWGWLLFRDGVVIYAYVRRQYRGARIAVRLLEAAGFDLDQEVPVAHLTKSARSIRSRSSMRLRYLPRL